MKNPRLVAAVFFTVSCVAAQDGEPGRESITLKGVTETVHFLASDEMAGRDSPSPQLEVAADYLAGRFKAAGLKSISADGSYFHTFTMPGVKLDPTALRCVVHTASGDRTLEPGKDVRLWKCGSKFSAESTDVLRLGDDPSRGGLSFRIRGRKPVIYEVSGEAVIWRSLATPRVSLTSRLGRSAPWLLIREGVLPESDVKISLEVPELTAVPAELRNVVGILEGTDRRDEIVLMSAHYDHVGIGTPLDGDAIYNGADDNATGTTAVVMLAEAFAARKTRPSRSIVFACFAAEEKGLVGSKQFVKQSPIKLEQIIVNVNVEMIGRPMPGKDRSAWVTGREFSNFEEIASRGLSRAGIEVMQFPPSSSLFTASDNYPFARAGIIAHSISAGSLHDDYHRPGDEVEKLHLEHMTAIIGGLYEVVSDFASMKGRPAYNESGKKRLRIKK
ncbi:MAG: M20/M25/M40 family metallo-hydrolase [Planctomycetota bacterium]|jgi:hypothetical protein|nr:M20/M25/M40 family metallo-hydrolase [Planctomycetota bacterium]